MPLMLLLNLRMSFTDQRKTGSLLHLQKKLNGKRRKETMLMKTKSKKQMVRRNP